MASHLGSDPYDDHHESSFTTNYPHSLQTRGGISAFAPNRTTTSTSTPTVFPSHPSLLRRPPIPEDFRMASASEAQQSDLIDTAIVIKNIPFGYPEEDFVNKLFPQLGLVPPYAFNYHRDKSDRTFRGLAFANFNAPQDAQAAVDTLNNYELERRRLRVELKKRLPAEEEQRQRLARQSRRQVSSPVALGGAALGGVGTQDISVLAQSVETMMSMGGDILDPQLRPRVVPRGPSTPSPTSGENHLVFIADEELDMNDPDTLGFYTTLQLFRNDPKNIGMTLQFPSTLTAEQRRIVRSLAVRLSLDYSTYGAGQERFIVVSRSSLRSQLATIQHSEPSSLMPSFLLPEYTRQLPTARASHEQFTFTDPRPSSLRSVRSTGNLQSKPDLAQPPPLPQLPADYDPHRTTPSTTHEFRLAPRASQESVISTGNRSMMGFTNFPPPHPTRQPHGPPAQESTRGFTERPSRENFQIRPIGHGAKTPSRGSLSHGSAGRESASGSDTIMDLQIQSPHPPEF